MLTFQKFNPTIETENFKQLVNLIHESFSKHDNNATYTFKKVKQTI